MAYLVYPGATHTRFSHSIGTLYVADLLARNADINEQRHVRLAALLHDIGHGPFSHVSEDVLFKYNTDIDDVETEELHEAIGLKIIEQVFLSENMITRDDFEEVRRILTGRPSPGKPKKRSVDHDIVSGPLDADKMDYLLRDSYFCGVKYGVYDLDRLALSVQKFEDADTRETSLAVAAEDVSAVDQFVIAKHNITTQVYRHKVRRVADTMLERSILMALEEGNDDLAKVYGLRLDDEQYIHDYLHCDDEELVWWVLKGPDGRGKELMELLRKRKLVKEVFQEPLENCTGLETEDIVSKVKARKELSELEGELADACSISSPHMVFVDLWSQSAPRKPSSEPTTDTQRIDAITEQGERRSYDQVSQFFRHSEFPGEDLLCVYMPVEAAGRQAKQERRRQLRERICEVVGFESKYAPVPDSSQSREDAK